MRSWHFLAALCAATPLVLACSESEPKPKPDPAATPTEPLDALAPVSAEAWDETAVRKVLHAFALGGFASDDQIRVWADMDPHAAVSEIITFDTINNKLSLSNDQLPDETLGQLADFWGSAETENKIPAGERERYAKQGWASPARVWFRAMSRTGANPVRQRIGLWETNYHLAVNQDAGVNNWQIFRYYDDIMAGLAANAPYQQVLATAAQSAAIAVQYTHRSNVFEDAKFRGNEDFGRELHQLFFGILGVDDPEYHEFVTIRNTAKALTDMSVRGGVKHDGGEHDDEVVTFGTERHFPAPVEVYGTDVPGATARDKIAGIAEICVDHPESLENLPIIVIRGLADDALSDEAAEALRAAWAEMEPKSLLQFLRAYAASELFHSQERVKYWTSIERNIQYSSLMTLTPEEAYEGYFDPGWQVEGEGVQVFRPELDVFGGQTGLDAAGSGAVFRHAYNQSVERIWTFTRVDDDESDWERDWGAVIPVGADGAHRVRGVAEWLWQRFIADGLVNFGPVERANVYALLGAGQDLGLFLAEDDPLAVYDTEALAERELAERVSNMEVGSVDLLSEDSEARREANTRVGMAIAFIVVTPFAFAQEGR